MNPTQLPPHPTGQPSQPDDPELRDRYLRDAQEARAARRTESARMAAEVPPTRTPSVLIWVIAGFVSLVLVVVAGFALIGPMLKQTDTSEHTMPDGISRVELKNGFGDVHVRVAEPGEEPAVTSTVEWSLREPTVEVTRSGATAKVLGRCPEGIFTVCSTTWLVVVPAGTDVMINAGAGGVDLEGVDGDVDVNVGVGDVEISETSASRIVGNLGVGSLRIESLEPPQNVRAKIGVGDLSVRLPSDIDYDIDAKGGVGEVHNSLGGDPGSDRKVTLEAGVGSLTVGPS